MPMRINHGEVRRDSHNPAIDANPKEINTARFTCAEVAKPLATLIPQALLTLLVLPLTLSISRSVISSATGSALIPLLGKTGKLQMFFGALFAIALGIQ